MPGSGSDDFICQPASKGHENASALEIVPLERVDAFVGLGSNLGDRNHTLLKAWKMLGAREGIELVTISRPYVSAPVGMTSSNWFVNAAGWLKTCHSAHRLLDILLKTEKYLGRIRSGDDTGYQDRVVDLDLLYFGALIHADERLTLPHPHLYDRLFVLAPLASIAPEFNDPVKQTSVLALHDQLAGRIDQGVTANQQIEESDWQDDRAR